MGKVLSRSTFLGLQINKINTKSYDTFYKINGLRIYLLLFRNPYIADNRKPSSQNVIIRIIASSNCESRNKAVSKVS